MDSKLKFEDHHTATNIKRDNEFLGSIGEYGGRASFLCQHGSLIGHRYSAAELREIADRIEGFDQDEEKKTTTVKFIPSGAGLMVKNRQGYLGYIDTEGRCPGRWNGMSEGLASPKEMMEIAKKCAEIQDQVNTIRNLRKNLFK